MTLDEIVVGLHPLTTPSFPGLVIRQPSRADFRAIQPGLVRYSPVSILTKLDVEKQLPADYYRVREQASKKRDEIILQLREAESADERFLKTEEDIKNMSDTERADYSEYKLNQYQAFSDKLEKEAVIRQFGQYEETRQRIVDQTKEHETDVMRTEMLFATCAVEQEGGAYFASIDEGVKILESISAEEYSDVMQEFGQYVGGVNPSFF